MATGPAAGAHNGLSGLTSAGLSVLLVGAAAFVVIATVTGRAPVGLVGGPLQTTGPRVVSITPGGAQMQVGGRAGAPLGALTLADVDALAAAVPQALPVSRVVSGTAPLQIADQRVPQARIEGVDPAYIQLSDATLASGGFFSRQDATAANHVAVLGHTIAMRLFATDQSPLGQVIRIRAQPFSVVGVLTASGGDQDNAVLVPFQTAQIRLFGTGSVDELLVQAQTANQAEAVSQQAQHVLRLRHRVAPGQPDDFSISSDNSAQLSAGQADGDPRQTLSAAMQVLHQYACGAKNLCRPSASAP